MNRKNIIILCGPSCSGKSTWTKEFVKNNKLSISISRDQIRLDKFGPNYKFIYHGEEIVTSIFNYALESYLQFNDENIILDNTHIRERYIDEIITKYGNKHNIKIKFFIEPYWLLFIRNILRFFKTKRWTPIKVLKDQFDNFNKIDKVKYNNYIL